jgi:hypothetical protein
MTDAHVAVTSFANTHGSGWVKHKHSIHAEANMQVTVQVSSPLALVVTEAILLGRRLAPAYFLVGGALGAWVGLKERRIEKSSNATPGLDAFGTFLLVLFTWPISFPAYWLRARAFAKGTLAAKSRYTGVLRVVRRVAVVCVVAIGGVLTVWTDYSARGLPGAIQTLQREFSSPIHAFVRRDTIELEVALSSSQRDSSATAERASQIGRRFLELVPRSDACVVVSFVRASVIQGINARSEVARYQVAPAQQRR